jgi:hypothetical protein
LVDQLGLFGAQVSAPAVEPLVTDADRELAARLPPFVRFGRSSWSFAGWNGIVFRGSATDEDLARGGLAAYVQHPLFRAVGIDRSHYRPLRDEDLASYRAQIEASHTAFPALW